MSELYLAGGCFWGMQRFLDQFPGVLETEVGYANGQTENPSYEQVCRGSGHAETVRVRFDPAALSVSSLLEFYFMAIDPFSVNRQGEDSGIQYRTGVYYADPSLLPELRAFFAQKEQAFSRKLAVELLPLAQFYPAEEYHQNYLQKNPGGYCHIGKDLLALHKPDTLL